MGFIAVREQRRRFGWLAIAMLLAVAGCSGVLPRVPDEEALGARAQSYWDARVAGDRLTAFQYELVSLDDDPRARQRYLGRGGVRLLSAEVRDVRIVAEDHAEVVVAVQYRLAALTGGPRSYGGEQATVWMLRNGQWYHAGDSRE